MVVGRAFDKSGSHSEAVLLPEHRSVCRSRLISRFQFGAKALGRITLATADRDAAERGIIMSTDAATPAPKGWRDSLRPYLEPAPLAALFLGISSGDRKSTRLNSSH